MNRSHPARGAWIEISFSRRVSQHFPGRTPHGVRGLKWFTSCMLIDLTAGRTPHGVRGLKFLYYAILWDECRRTPHGVRGLK